MKFLKKYKSFLAVSTFLFIGTQNAYADVFDIPNPLQYEEIGDFFWAVTNILIQVGIGLVIFLVMLGALFIMIGGQDQKYVKKGKNLITYSIIGIFVIIFARAILYAVEFVVGS